MKYRIEWTREAERQLARGWLAHSDRNSFTAAANNIERKLSIDPRFVSREQSEGLYCLDLPPIRIYFEIDDANLVVTITAVRWK